MAQTKEHKGFVTLASLDGAPSEPLTMKQAKEKATKEGPLHVKRQGSEKVLMEIKADGSIVRLIDKSRFSFKQELAAEEAPAAPPAEEAPAAPPAEGDEASVPSPEEGEAPAAAPPAEEPGVEAEGGPQGGEQRREQLRAKLEARRTPPKKQAPGKFRRVLEERVLIPASVVIGAEEIQAPEGHRGEFGRLMHKHKAPPVRGNRGVHKAPADAAGRAALAADLRSAGFAVVERP